MIWAVAAIAFLGLAAFYSGCEMGLYRLNRLRLRIRAERGRTRGARALMRLVEREQESVLAVLLSQNMANYLLTVAVSAFLARQGGLSIDEVEFYTAAALSPVVFVLGDVVPKNVFQIHADRLMYGAARLLYATVLLCRWTGAVALLQALSRLGTRIAGHEEQEGPRGGRGEIVGLLRAGAAEAALSEEQTRIIERVMNLSSIRAGSIMIPWRQVATIRVDTRREVFEQVVRWHNYSRMPVVGTDRRTVLGIVSVLDVLADDQGEGIERWVRPALTIPASDSAAAALLRLQKARATMAVVTDPRRGPVGILTLKDVVEEIFGELPAW